MTASAAFRSCVNLKRHAPSTCFIIFVHRNRYACFSVYMMMFEAQTRGYFQREYRCFLCSSVKPDSFKMHQVQRQQHLLSLLEFFHIGLPRPLKWPRLGHHAWRCLEHHWVCIPSPVIPRIGKLAASSLVKAWRKTSNFHGLVI